MKIIDNRQKKYAHFSELEIGDLFKIYDTDIYKDYYNIKISNSCKCCNWFSISHNISGSAADVATVEKLECELIIK